MNEAPLNQLKGATRQVICPQCGRSNGVEKISTLYLAGIKVKRPSTAGQPGKDLASQVLARLPGLTPQALHTLSRELAPPAEDKGVPTRPVHPDLVVLVFSLAIPIFFIGIFDQQRAALIPVILFLALAYGLYFFKRKRIIEKFSQTQAGQKEKQARIARQVKNWMKLYYCTQDKGVFLPGKRELAPLEEMLNLLEE